MEDLYRTLNRLKCRGMKGWSPAKEEWLRKTLENEDIAEVVKYLKMFVDRPVDDRRVFILEDVVHVAIKCVHEEPGLFIDVCNQYFNK